MLSASSRGQKSALQWRAGQLPGQTLVQERERVRVGGPSMEGRTIARPDVGRGTGRALPGGLQWRAGQLPGQTRDRHDDQPPALNPSMEGRTIARPDASTPAVLPHVFNLQWRAGQLPGQTRGASVCVVAAACTFNGGPDNCPARRGHPTPRGERPLPFNGGPDNCPARPAAAKFNDQLNLLLQWRAGQLPGQTSPRRTARTGARRSFNGGPDNCPARRDTPAVRRRLQ